MKTSFLAVPLVAALAAHAPAAPAEDDLQVVRKAVSASPRLAQARPPAEAPPGEAKPLPPKTGPRWLRIRIDEKAGKHARVAINLPIGIARALGDDWPVAPRGRCHDDRCPTLGEVLRALDSGQSLVEIDDDEATVRVWVD